MGIKQDFMNYYYKYIFALFSIYFLLSCISAQDINKTYKRGSEAKIKQHEEKDLPLLSFGTKEEEEEERVKVEGFITKTIDSLNIPLDGLIIILDFQEPQDEIYYFFEKDYENIYFFRNTTYMPSALEIGKYSKKSYNNDIILTIYNYFNSSDYKEKRLDMDFCAEYSRFPFTVLKIENKKVKLFYLEPLDMCKNNNVFEALEGDKIVRWKFNE